MRYYQHRLVALYAFLFLLVVLLCVSVMPSRAFAFDTDDSCPAPSTVSAVSSLPNQAVIQLSEESFEALPYDQFEYTSSSSDAFLASQDCMLAYDQSIVDSLGVQCDAWSSACLGYAAAYCEIVTTGNYWSWTDFDGNGGLYGESNFYGRNMTNEFDCYQTYDQQSTLRRLYDAINAGHPCIVYVTTNSGNQHWVAIVGYEDVSNPDSLQLSNFIMLDSNYAYSCEPTALSERGYTLRYGDTFGNVRVCKNATGHASTKVATEWFDDCFYGDWFVDSGVIEYAVNHSLIYGYSGTKLFLPWNFITRGEAVTMLYRLAGEPDVTQAAKFSDVNYKEYYGNSINWARSTGVVNGYDNENAFKPNKTITREELACMIANYAEKIAGFDMSTDYEAFYNMPDYASVSPFARKCVSWCLDCNIMNGEDIYGTAYLNPVSGAWRSSMASMIVVLHRDLL